MYGNFRKCLADEPAADFMQFVVNAVQNGNMSISGEVIGDFNGNATLSFKIVDTDMKIFSFLKEHK